MPQPPIIPITAEQWAAIEALLVTYNGMSQEDLEDRIAALEAAQERDEILIAALKIVLVLLFPGTA